MPEPPTSRPSMPPPEPTGAGGLPASLRHRWHSATPSARRTVWTALIAFVVLVASYIAVGPSPALAANHAVSMVNVSYNPASVTVAPGDSVTWTNNETGGTVHTVTADDASYASGNISPGTSYSHTYLAPGTFTYHCSIHTFMTGTVTVTTAGPSPSVSASTSRPPSPSPSASVTPTASPTTAPPSPSASASPSASPSSGPQPCSNVTLGADQGDGTRLAAYTTAADGYKEFLLCMSPVQWEVQPGVVRSAYAFNGIVPGPTIKVNEGDNVRIVVQNNLPEMTAVHWHGMILPNDQDGVAGITQPAIAAGATYTYQWTAKATGTHWYHSHMSGSQVGKGLYGALVVTPTLGDIAADKHYSIEIGDGANGLTFNGKTFPATVPLTARVGQKVHIRLIGTGPELIHPIHLHGFPFQVVAQDGRQLPAAYTADTILVGPGQTYDIITQPVNPGTWLLHCHIFSHSEVNGAMTGLVTTLVVTA